MFGDHFGDNFLFYSISSLDFYSLLFLYNLLSVLFDFYLRYIFIFCNHLFKRTLLWLINLAQLIVWEFKKGNESIWWRNCKKLMIFPSQIGKRCKVKVTHAIKRFHWVCVINEDTVCSCNCNDHVIWLFKQPLFRILFLEKYWTKFTY